MRSTSKASHADMRASATRNAPCWRLATLSVAALVLVTAPLAGCGVGQILKRGDTALVAGRYDEAIAAYDEAATNASNDEEQAIARRGANEARVRAAVNWVGEGDRALERHGMAEAGEAYRKARIYAPTEPRVIAALSRLLELRTRVETTLASSAKTLESLSAETGPAKVSEWRALCQELSRLRAWRADYPQTETLWDRARRTFAALLVVEARAANADGRGDLASALAGEALRYDPTRSEATELRESVASSEGAANLLEAGRRFEATGDLDAALATYAKAVTADPNNAEARSTFDTARNQWVNAHLSAARKAEKARKRRDALLLLRQAADYGTADPKLAKQLEAASSKAHASAAQEFYKRGVSYEKRKLDGAAMIAYRTATALGGQQKDLGSRLESTLRRLDSARRYGLTLEPIAAPKELEPETFAALRNTIEARIGDAALAAAGIDFVPADKKAKSAQGKLRLELARYDTIRVQRDEARSKKILDHVEFPPNPEWSVAQSAQASALATLNAAGERLRPLEAEANQIETKIAEADTKLAEIRKRIDEEDATFYAGKKGPCTDGSTRCPESHGHQRWAKQLQWYSDKVRTETAKLAALADRLQQARTDEQAAQVAFDAAERRARETPTKLREEIWRDHAYSVRMDELRIEINASLAWFDETSGRELDRTTARMEDLRVDYSTPEIIVKEQLVEAARTSALLDDDALRTELVPRLIERLVPQIWASLTHQGKRLALRAEAARNADERLHWQVLALGVAEGLDDGRRSLLSDEVRAKTGYDWDRLAVDLAQIPW